MRTGTPDLRKEGGRLKTKKRAPVVLERWFGPQKPKAESLSSGDEGGGSEDCPAGTQEKSQGRK